MYPYPEGFDEQRIRELYDFFTDAERTQQHFMLIDIVEHSPYNKKQARTKVRRHWSWFLRPVTQQAGKPHTFRCEGLIRYPQRYFIAAHVPRQGKYFYPFAVSLKATTTTISPILPVPGEELASVALLPADDDQDAPDEVRISTFVDTDDTVGLSVLDNDIPLFDPILSPQQPVSDPLRTSRPPESSWFVTCIIIIAIIVIRRIVDTLRP